jgi:hypothetical protein
MASMKYSITKAGNTFVLPTMGEKADMWRTPHGFYIFSLSSKAYTHYLSL